MDQQLCGVMWLLFFINIIVISNNNVRGLQLPSQDESRGDPTNCPEDGHGIFMTLNGVVKNVHEIHGDNFEIICRSLQPVKIGFDGVLVNRIVNSSRSRLDLDARGIDPHCYELRVTIPSGKQSTGKYTCSQINNKGNLNENSTYVYSTGDNPSSYLLGNGHDELFVIPPTDKQDVLIIPCRTSKSKVLIRLHHGQRELTEDPRIKYDPRIGFMIPKLEELNLCNGLPFTCTEENHGSMSLKTVVKCPNLSKSENMDLSITTQSASDPKKTGLICLGGTRMTFTKCANPMECEFVKSCAILPSQFECDMSKNYEPGRQTQPKRFLEIDKDANGMIFCSNNINTITRFVFHDFTNDSKITIINPEELEETFSSLQYSQSNTWMNFVPTEYDGSWNGLDTISYSERITFQCNVSKIVAAASIQWNFTLRNGSQIPATILRQEVFEDKKLYSSTVKIIFDNMDIRILTCSAPLWNNEIISNSHHLIVEEMSGPEIENPETENLTLYYNQIYNLPCTARGTPKDIVWEFYKNGVRLEFGAAGYPTSRFQDVGKTNASIQVTYKFPEDDEGFSNFTCTAQNLVTHELASKHFLVKWEEPLRATNTGLATWQWVAVVIGLAFVCILSLILSRYWWSKGVKKVEKYPVESILRFFDGGYVPMGSVASSDCERQQENGANGSETDSNQYRFICSKPYNKEKEIPEKNLIFEEDSVSAKGNFGVVRKARLHQKDKDTSSPIYVAVKTLKPGFSEADFDNFLDELKVLQYVGKHENVVEYIGAVTKDIENSNVKIVIEYCQLKDLSSYLSEQSTLLALGNHEMFPAGHYSSVSTVIAPSQAEFRPVTTTDLLTWAKHIASGMAFLAEKRLIHRDLAARNVLLTENRVAKITDFGFSKNLYQSDKLYYRQATDSKSLLVPIRWLPIESLVSRKYSTDSDIWAFGVTLWELFSIGEEPYRTNPKVDDRLLLLFLQRGDRLARPRFANDTIYEIMKSCWATDGSDRPRFHELKDMIMNAENEIGFTNTLLDFNSNNGGYMDDDSDIINDLEEPEVFQV